MILALNTAEAVHELALLDGSTLLAESRWTNTHEDVDNLVPSLQKLLDEKGLSKKDITQLVVLRGPGSYTSVRVGIAFVNGLKEGLGAELYEIDTFDFLKLKAARAEDVLVVLHAGGLDVGLRYKDEEKVGALAPLLAAIPHGHELHVLAELPPALMNELRSLALEKSWTLLEGHELQTLGETLQTFGLSAFKKVDLAAPFYLRGPHITVPTDPWKKP